MKSFSHALALIVLFLSSCQSPMPTRLLSQQNIKQTSLEHYYPLNAGRSWSFDLVQRQNGVDNTKFKSMTLYTEALSSNNGAERAILHRLYPDTSVKPNPSLAQRFTDRVELSRYQAESKLNPQADLMMLQVPSNHPLSSSLRGNPFITALQMPLQAGQKWPGRSFQGGTETITVKGNETVNVPAGQFETILIEHHLQYNNGKEDFLRYWYAPGIGMIKMHEEITAYFNEWLKLESDGILTAFHP